VPDRRSRDWARVLSGDLSCRVSARRLLKVIVGTLSDLAVPVQAEERAMRPDLFPTMSPDCRNTLVYSAVALIQVLTARVSGYGEP
jgi:hypothetical protein